jgi:hypothetical protein
MPVNGVLMNIFGSKREETIGGWRELNSEYSSLNIIQVMTSRRKWVGNVSRMREKRNGSFF